MKPMFLTILMLLTSWAAALENSLVMRSPGQGGGGIYAVVSPSTGNVTLYGIEGTARIVLARGRKDVWFVDIKRRTSKISPKDGEAFIDLRDKLQQRYPGQKVTGWLVTTADVDNKAKSFIAEMGCFATSGAAKR